MVIKDREKERLHEYVESTNKALSEHIKQLRKFEMLPHGWIWHEDKVKELETIDEELIHDLIKLYELHREQHLPKSKIEHKVLIEMEYLFGQIRKAERVWNDRKKYEKTSEEEKRIDKLINKAIGDLSQLYWKGINEMKKKIAELMGVDMNYINDDYIKVERWIKFWDELVEIAHLTGHNKGRIFENFIASYGAWVNEECLQFTLEIVRATHENSYKVFEDPKNLNYFLNNFLRWYEFSGKLQGFVKIMKATGNDAEDIAVLIRYTLPSLDGQIKSCQHRHSSWQEIVDYICKVHITAKSALGFIPATLFDHFRFRLERASYLYKSGKRIDLSKGDTLKRFLEVVNQRGKLARRYLKRHGRTAYTKKLISDNFWTFKLDRSRIERLKFEKTGSQLIPLGGRFKGKHLVRIVPQASYDAWKKAQESGIPVEDIVKAFPLKNGTVRVFCKYEGEVFSAYKEEHPELSDDLENQREDIVNRLNDLGIVHGHLHIGNFTVKEEKGLFSIKKITVKAIDFDEAKS